jgi:hypothetical protein
VGVLDSVDTWERPKLAPRVLMCGPGQERNTMSLRNNLKYSSPLSDAGGRSWRIAIASHGVNCRHAIQNVHHSASPASSHELTRRVQHAALRHSTILRRGLIDGTVGCWHPLHAVCLAWRVRQTLFKRKHDDVIKAAIDASIGKLCSRCRCCRWWPVVDDEHHTRTGVDKEARQCSMKHPRRRLASTAP